MNMQSSVIILSLLSSICFAADAANIPVGVPLPPDAQAAVDHESQAEADLKSDYDAKVAKLHQDLVLKLKRFQDAAIHRDDLDGAESIKAAMSRYMPNDGKPIEKIDLTKLNPEFCVPYKKVVFITAKYGADDRLIDSMAFLRRVVKGENLVLTDTNAGGDPAPNVGKALHLEWCTADSVVHRATVPENTSVNLDEVIK